MISEPRLAAGSPRKRYAKPTTAVSSSHVAPARRAAMPCSRAASARVISNMPKSMSCAVFTSKHGGYMSRRRISSCINSVSGSTSASTSNRAPARGGINPMSSSYRARRAARSTRCSTHPSLLFARRQCSPAQAPQPQGERVKDRHEEPRQEEGQQEGHHAPKDIPQGNVRRDVLDDVRVDADGRRDDAHFRGQHDEVPKPNGV